MEQVVTIQKNFFKSHKTKDITFRIRELNRLKSTLQEHISLLNKAIYKDFKKSSFENYTSELAIIFHDIQEAKRNLYKWSRKEKVTTNFVNFPAKSYRIPEPLGTCLVIGAWNYPYLLSLGPVVAAIAAGNTVILKPSEIPSNTSNVLALIINNAFDPQVLKVIEGGIPETTTLLQQKFDKIFFTGSTTVGKIIYKAAAAHLTPVTLELGGKSPAIITKGANLKMTVKRLIWGKYLNAGQTCIAPDYVLVDNQIKEQFLSIAKAEIAKAKYNVTNNNYTQIIDHRNYDRLEKMLDTSSIYYGGATNKGARYIAPTILTNITLDHPSMQEEIFGPILPVLGYNTFNEAIDVVLTYPKPLACYVFTSSKKLKERVFKEISFGGGAVNDAVMHISNPHLPFGGVGDSGIGSYHGKAGFDCFSHYKSVLDKPTWFELPLKFSPYSNRKLNWIRQLFKL